MDVMDLSRTSPIVHTVQQARVHEAGSFHPSFGLMRKNGCFIDPCGFLWSISFRFGLPAFISRFQQVVSFLRAIGFWVVCWFLIVFSFAPPPPDRLCIIIYYYYFLNYFYLQTLWCVHYLPFVWVHCFPFAWMRVSWVDGWACGRETEIGAIPGLIWFWFFRQPAARLPLPVV